MPARAVLTALAVLAAVGCSGSDGPAVAPRSLTNVNADSTYAACVPDADLVGLGAVIVAFTPDGGPPRLAGTRVVDPAHAVQVVHIEVLVDQGTVEQRLDAPLFQVVGLDSAFASAVEPGFGAFRSFPHADVTARPDGTLGPPVTLGWHSLVVAVEPSTPLLSVYDMAIHYRVDDGAPVAGSLGMQWQLRLDDCARTEADPAPDMLVPDGQTEWVTVYTAHAGEPRTVVTRMPG